MVLIGVNSFAKRRINRTGMGCIFAKTYIVNQVAIAVL